MKVTYKNLKKLLPGLVWPEEQLLANLAMIGHETEKTNDHLEVKIFPNRGDCLSLYGLSRDLVGNYPELGDLSPPETAELPEASNFFHLNISPKASNYVHADAFLKIEGYQPTKSPAEVVETLNLHGLQAKDLIVDLTNILTYELGLPLHAFDYDEVQSGLEIDLSIEGERVELISGKSVELDPGLLIQRSDEQVVDLAGVMGAKNSATTSSTRTLLIQAAGFDSTIVRKNCVQTGIATEASYRYQRGVDSSITETVLARLYFLLKKYCPTVTISGYQVMSTNEKVRKIHVEPEMVSRILGVEVSVSNISKLDKLGFEYEDKQVSIPLWRKDVVSVADISEEVAKVMGLNNLPQKGLEKQKERTSEEYEKQLLIKLNLRDLGFNETSSISFVEEGGSLSLRNPRTKEQYLMRRSMLNGLLGTLSKNPYLKKVSLFEIGHVFLPEEKEYLGIVVTGVKEPAVEKIAEEIDARFNVRATFAQIDPGVLSKSDVKQPKVWFIEIPIEKMQVKSQELPKFVLRHISPISKFPPVLRDITLVVDESVDSEWLGVELKKTDNVLVAELVDMFSSSEAIGEGKVALTYRLIFQSLDKSFIDSEVSSWVEKRLNNLKKEVNFELR